jgi:ATP-dependent RNA helicase DeaD
MARTKDKSLRFLVATDIAARGIDISGLSHVMNFQLPESPEVYIHRTGRTGRAGREGTAISLIGPREIGVYYYLKRIYKLALQERSVPTQAEIELRREERRTQSLVTEILEAVGGEAPTDPALRAQTVRLLERDDAVEVVGTLLAIFRQRREAGAAAEPAKRAGGVLESVPKPAAVAPGGRPTTLEGVAQRVAIVQGEFRGLPGGRKPARERARISEEERQAIELRQRGEEPPPPPPAPTDEQAAAAAARAPEPAPRPERTARPADREAPSPAREERRPPREERRPAEPRAERPTPPTAPAPSDEGDRELLKLYVSIGERDGVGAEELRDTLADLAGLEPDDLVEIDMYGRHSYVTVDADFAEDLIAAVNGETFGNRKIRVELARDEA